VHDPVSLLQQLVSFPAPPGQEEAVRNFLAERVRAQGLRYGVDAKGNLAVPLCTEEPARVVVTAHMDEVAMMVQSVAPDGCLEIGPLGGLHPWKLGEGPVQVLGDDANVDGVLCFGSIHTEHPSSNVVRSRQGCLTWDMAYVFTGLSEEETINCGVRPGSRIVIHPLRRGLFRFGAHVGGYFMDDRADLVAWLAALEVLSTENLPATFLATAAEEVGGEGALYAMGSLRPDVCIALELGPDVEDAPVALTDQPTVWVADSFSNMSAADGKLVRDVADGLGFELQFQALSRGGGDASCAASHGHCARPITLGIPMANSHGFEIIHPEAMTKLAELTVALVRHLCG